MDTNDEELTLGESESALGFRGILVRNVLNRALTEDIRMTVLKRQVTLLISAPNEVWASAIMEPLAARFSRIAVRQAALDSGGDSAPYIAPHFFRRSPVRRTQDKEDADLPAALKALRNGASVIGVFSPMSAPMAFMVERNDIQIEIERPILKDIQDAYHKATGNMLPDNAPGVLDGADLDGLDWLIRPRDTVQDIAKRLQAPPAGASIVDDVPDLHELHGYGAAMDWALDVQRTLSRIRAGEPDASFLDLPRGCFSSDKQALAKLSSSDRWLRRCRSNQF